MGNNPYNRKSRQLLVIKLLMLKKDYRCGVLSYDKKLTKKEYTHDKGYIRFNKLSFDETTIIKNWVKWISNQFEI